MALQKATSFRGLSASSAYYEITEMHSSKPRGITSIGYIIYADATKANQLDFCALDLPYDPDMTVKKAYTAMKQMPEFSGAADV